MLSRPRIVAPDTAHWARWIDDALSSDSGRRGPALGFHDRLLAQGRLPLLTWHHLEELLCVSSAPNAAARAEFIRSIPMLALMAMPGEVLGAGAVTDILAAEAIAAHEGANSTGEVRDRARAMLLRVGTGADAIGSEARVWDVARIAMLEGKPHSGMVAALSELPGIDASQTFGAVASQRRTSPEERLKALAEARTNAYAEALAADPDGSVTQASAFADAFVSRMIELLPPDDMSPREVMTQTYRSQGLDDHEIRDDATIDELSTLATFRTQLRVVSAKTGLSFEQLKRIPDNLLPSRRIAQALRRHGQKRAVRPASDMHDRALATLAAYVDVLYVDKRTHEDFLRMTRQEKDLAALLGTVEKTSSYLSIAE